MMGYAPRLLMLDWRTVCFWRVLFVLFVFAVFVVDFALWFLLLFSLVAGILLRCGYVWNGMGLFWWDFAWTPYL